jgi:L-ascorbate 6-phosphate lactonase
MGFIIKSPSGTVIAVDAYLTDSCRAIGETIGIDLGRQVPVFIEPEELDVDHVLCTHSHQDHADPETLLRMPKRSVRSFVGPGLVTEIYRRCEVTPARIEHVYPGAKVMASDLVVQGTFAMPTDDSDLNHMGYVIGLEGGPRVYLTGDTDFHALLGHVGKLSPDVMIPCINGGFNNMSHWEAAELARLVKPKIAIPCHYDMFKDNLGDPAQFQACLRVAAPEVRYQKLEHMAPFVVS